MEISGEIFGDEEAWGLKERVGWDGELGCSFLQRLILCLGGEFLR